MMLATDHYLEQVEAHRQRVCAQLLHLVKILTKTSEIMAEEHRSALRARWSDPEIAAMVDYLHEHRSEGAQGGKFKQSAFNAVAVHIQPLLVSGKAKDGSSVKTKFSQVCALHFDAMD
ncbi:hypothetical protein JVU11DRAFT_9253 [Chiua virens]|nr:hypothetical protein JVU11DRAFT_9253 [Chiua virens]